MKKTIIITITSIISLNVYSQEITKIYSYSNGIRSLNPTSTIYSYENRSEVYEHDKHGLRKLHPSATLYKRKNGEVEVYENKGGIRSLHPSSVATPPDKSEYNRRIQQTIIQSNRKKAEKR